MPKIVDHELRRREVSRAAVRVIARDGLEGATTRAVAAESGWTTGVLKHYFASKDHILMHALRELERASWDRLQATEKEPNGFASLRRAVLSILGDDPDHAKVWVAFLARGATDPFIGGEVRRGARVWQHRWAEMVRRGQADGSISQGVDAHQIATELWALLSGLRVAALFDPAVMRRLRRGALAFLESISEARRVSR
jgi:AcrR family transcriptional regulator